MTRRVTPPFCGRYVWRLSLRGVPSECTLVPQEEGGGLSTVNVLVKVEGVCSVR